MQADPREFRLPVFGGQVVVHTDAAAFQADRARRHPAGEPLPPAAGRTCKLIEESGAATYLVGVFDGRTSTAAHELLHVIAMAAERAHVDIRHDNAETAASLLSDLMALAGYDDTPRPQAWMVVNHDGHRAVYIDAARAREVAAHRRAVVVDLVPAGTRPAS